MIQIIEHAQQAKVVLEAAQGAEEKLDRGVVLALLELELRVGRYGEACSVVGEYSLLYLPSVSTCSVRCGCASRPGHVAVCRCSSSRYLYPEVATHLAQFLSTAHYISPSNLLALTSDLDLHAPSARCPQPPCAVSSG